MKIIFIILVTNATLLHVLLEIRVRLGYGLAAPTLPEYNFWTAWVSHQNEGVWLPKISERFVYAISYPNCHWVYFPYALHGSPR